MNSGPAEPVACDLDREFASRFGGGERPRAFHAPGRVNLMGAHLDYNGGAVMPMAIDRGTLALVRATRSGRVRLASVRERGEFDAPLDALPDAPTGRWYDYPIGVVRQLRDRFAGGSGIDVLFAGDLPIGAGLSSSASICVVTALGVDRVLGGDSGPSEWIERALASERGFVGVQCGIMDPFAVGLGRPGHLLWLDCSDRSTEHVPLDAGRYAVGIVDSGVRRELAAGEFNVRVAQCGELLAILRGRDESVRWLRDVDPGAFERSRSSLPEVLVRRGEHVFGEFVRTGEARAALARGDVARFGSLMTQSHASLRDCYEVSIPELDTIVDAATDVPGVLGARLTGAGFGGCCVVLLERGATESLAEDVERTFMQRHGHRPTISFFAGGEGPREVATD
ncbi:MAG: galactokinase [Planctomycetota bacterium]